MLTDTGNTTDGKFLVGILATIVSMAMLFAAFAITGPADQRVSGYGIGEPVQYIKTASIDRSAD